MTAAPDPRQVMHDDWCPAIRHRDCCGVADCGCRAQRRWRYVAEQIAQAIEDTAVMFRLDPEQMQFERAVLSRAAAVARGFAENGGNDE